MDPCYLLGDAQGAKAVCSVQVQVVLGPADDLFLALPFGVSLKTDRRRITEFRLGRNLHKYFGILFPDC